jgi:hypothetical protein
MTNESNNQPYIHLAGKRYQLNPDQVLTRCGHLYPMDSPQVSRRFEEVTCRTCSDSFRFRRNIRAIKRAEGDLVIPGSEVLTVPEVALELRCSSAHVHNLINGTVKGVQPLPSIRMGRRRVVRRESLDQWMRDNERVTANDMLPPSPDVDAVDA